MEVLAEIARRKTMDDLIKRLRANALDECDEAADRIEELEAKGLANRVAIMKLEAKLVEIGEVSVREAARVLLDAARIEPVHDAIQRSVRPAAFCAALRAIAEGKE
jgi:hypothetical protein